MATTASAVINTTDTGSGTPTVPNATATTKWQEYIWIRHLEAGNTNKAKIYVWNPNATSDATYLKWQEVSGASAFSDLTGTATANQLPSSIPYSKLALSGQILNTDLWGGITSAKLAGSITYDKISTVNASTVTSVSNSKLPVNVIPTLSNSDIDTILGAASVDYAKLNISSYSFPADRIANGISSAQITSLDGAKLTGTVNNDRLDYMFYRNHPTVSLAQGSGTVNLHTALGSNAFEGVIRQTIISNSSEVVIALPHPSTAAYLGKSAKLSIFRGFDGTGAVKIKVCDSGTDSSSFEADNKIVHKGELTNEATILPAISVKRSRKIVVDLLCESVSTDSGGGQWIVTHHREEETSGGNVKGFTGVIIGDGTKTRFEINHGLNTYNVFVQVRRPLDPFRTDGTTAATPTSTDDIFPSTGTPSKSYSYTLSDMGFTDDIQVATVDDQGALSLNHVTLDFDTNGAPTPNTGDEYLVTVLGI